MVKTFQGCHLHLIAALYRQRHETKLVSELIVPYVLSPRDLVFRPDIMDETVKSSFQKLTEIVLYNFYHRNLFIGPIVYFIFFFGFSLTSLSILFHSYRDEPIGRWGKTGVPRENHLTYPQAEHGLSHMWPVRGSNLHQSQRMNDE